MKPTIASSKKTDYKKIAPGSNKYLWMDMKELIILMIFRFNLKKIYNQWSILYISLYIFI